MKNQNEKWDCCKMLFLSLRAIAKQSLTHWKIKGCFVASLLAMTRLKHFATAPKCKNIKKILSTALIFSFFIFNFSFICFAQDKFIYDAKGKRNPFIPLVTADGRLLKLDVEEAKGDLVIEGIIYDEQGVSYAIVNGSVVKAGDFIDDDAQVLRVEKGKVVLIKGGKELELELLKTSKDIENRK